MVNDTYVRGAPVPQRKIDYANTLRKYLKEYSKIMIISVDNVGSSQLQKVRVMIRGRGKILMGKNTIIRKVLRQEAEKGTPGCAALLPLVRLNIGFVFSNGSLADIRKEILEEKEPAAAKTGVLAPMDVFIPAGPTGLDPGQTSFFQALNIATKITRGAIEITSKVHIAKMGEKVTASAVALMNKMSIRPFFYRINCCHVMENGSVYPADVLDIDPAMLEAKFRRGVRSLAAVSLGLYYPTAASIAHTFSNTVRQAIAICLPGEYSFKYAEPYKAFLSGKKDDSDEEEEGDDE